MPRHYTLTPELVAAHAGGPVVALDPGAVGRSHRAFSRRPGPDRNRSASAMLADLRAEMVYGPQGVIRAEPEPPPVDVLVVTIEGPIEQRAGQHEPSGSWVDGHDAIYERFAAAFEVGDVVCIGDSPGGVVVSGPEMIRRAQEMKAKHGRRCIGFTETGAFSMCLWWMAALCDEIYVSRDGRLGSIGARGSLLSIAGALAKDGIAVEIVEDPIGKAAGAPERPIDDEARERASEEVTAAADMFRAAVCESPFGQRHKLTPDALKAMRGRTYQGQNAVTVGLADGVETLESVLAYALATAGEGVQSMGADKDPKDKPGDGPEGEAPMKCTRCGEEPGDKDARFCAKCGEKMPGDGPEGEDEPPPSSQRKPHPEPDKDDAKATAAHYSSSSVLALRAAATTMHRTLDAIGRLVGAKSHGEILGCVEAVAKDAANAVRYRKERNEERAKAEQHERIDILTKLAAADPKGHPRGKLLVDVVQDGKIVGVRPAKLWGDGPEGRTLANLRGYARTVLAAEPTAETTERSPFDAPTSPDPKAAADGEPTPGEIEAAKRDPVVLLAAQTTPSAKLDDLAKNHVFASRAARRAQVPA